MFTYIHQCLQTCTASHASIIGTFCNHNGIHVNSLNFFTIIRSRLICPVFLFRHFIIVVVDVQRTAKNIAMFYFNIQFIVCLVFDFSLLSPSWLYKVLNKRLVGSFTECISFFGVFCFVCLFRSCFCFLLLLGTLEFYDYSIKPPKNTTIPGGNKTFSLWRHLTTTTRILQFLFSCAN